MQGESPILRLDFSNGKEVNVTEDIRDKGDIEQPTRFLFQFFGRSMALDIAFPELVVHVVGENITQVEIRMAHWENHVIVVTCDEISGRTSWPSV